MKTNVLKKMLIILSVAALMMNFAGCGKKDSKSSNANLKKDGIVVTATGGKADAVSGSGIAWNVMVDFGVTAVKVTVTAEDGKKAKVNGVEETSSYDVSMTGISTTATGFTIKAENGDEKKYTLTITKKVNPAIAATEEKVKAYEDAANGDLTTQDKVTAAKAKAPGALDATLTQAEKDAFAARIDAAKAKIDAGQKALDDAAYAAKKAVVETAVKAYEAAAAGDLSTYDKVTAATNKKPTVDATLTETDKKAFNDRIAAADKKIADAKKVLDDAAADAAKAKEVDDALLAMAPVDLSKADQVAAVRAKYDALTAAQKALVKQLALLEEFETTIADLALVKAKEEIKTALGNNAEFTVSATATAVTLPTAVTGATIVWTTTSDAIDITTGAIKRPAYGADDVVVVLTGTITSNGKTETVTYVITVEAEINKAVKSIQPIADIAVGNGTPKTSIPFSKTVVLVLEDDTDVVVPVVWETSTPAYDAMTAGDYTFTGTPDLTGVANVKATDLKAVVKVTVKAAVATTIKSVKVTLTDKWSMAGKTMYKYTVVATIDLVGADNAVFYKGSIVSADVIKGVVAGDKITAEIITNSVELAAAGGDAVTLNGTKTGEQAGGAVTVSTLPKTVGEETVYSNF